MTTTSTPAPPRGAAGSAPRGQASGAAAHPLHPSDHLVSDSFGDTPYGSGNADTAASRRATTVASAGRSDRAISRPSRTQPPSRRVGR